MATSYAPLAFALLRSLVLSSTLASALFESLAAPCLASATSAARLACAAATSLATASGDFALLQPEAPASVSSATNDSITFCIEFPLSNYSTILICNSLPPQDCHLGLSAEETQYPARRSACKEFPTHSGRLGGSQSPRIRVDWRYIPCRIRGINSARQQEAI